MPLNRLKIAIVGYNPTKIGGIESFSRSLKTMLEGCDVNFVYEYNEIGTFAIERTDPVLPYNYLSRLCNKISLGFLTQFLIKIKLKKNNYDLFILNSPKYLDLVPDLSKTILVQHTSVDNWWYSKFKFNQKEKLLSLSKKVYKIISLSEKEKKALIEKFNYSENLLLTINMINELPLLRNKKNEVKRLIMLTRFQNEIKRVDLAISAMKLLPEYKLDIYGSGKDKKYLQGLARSYSNVSINPSTNDKLSVLDHSGIYILTSDIEGYPVSVIEAMSRGLPVILRNTFLSASNIVKGNGVLLEKEWDEIEFSNAVKYCSENYESLSNQSITLSEKHNIFSVKKEWEELVNKVCDK